MLTGRSVILAIVIVVILSLVATTLSLLGSNDSRGLGQDTHGTKRHGFRAVFDTLEALGIDAKRTEIFAPESLPADTTVVLWRPDTHLVSSEPTYLQRLSAWVRGGGRVVVAPTAEQKNKALFRRALADSPIKETTALAELGLPEVALHEVDLTDGAIAAERSGTHRDEEDEDSLNIKDRFRRALVLPDEPILTAPVAGDGSLSDLASLVTSLEVPQRLSALDVGNTKPSGTLTIGDSQRQTHVIAAIYPLGAGEIIVVSEPALFENRLIGLEDNAVLAVHLFGDGDRAVRWDGFYNGLTIRGQPLLLLTHGPYAILTLLIVAATFLWVWRSAVFLGPPLTPLGAVRRNLAEYVEAMARFVQRGPTSHHFVLSEFRDGVLASIRKRLRLPVGDGSSADLASSLARHDPAAAQRLLDAVAHVDLLLSQRSRLTDRLTLEALKGLDDCL